MAFHRLATARWALVLLLSSAAAAAQPEAPLVELPTDWKVGETLRLEIVQERIDSAGGKETPGGTSRGILEARVQARNETGYVFVWTYSAGWFDEIAQGRLPVSTQRLQEVAGDLSLVMQTDESGVPQRLLNRDEAVGVFKRVLDELLKEKQGEPPPPEVAEVVAMFTKPEVVESLLLRSAQVFYFAGGAALEVGEAIEYADSLPNPFGGDPFPSRGVIALQEHRPERDEAMIVWHQEIDREKASAAIAAILRRLMPVAKDEEMPTLDVRDRAVFTMDTKTGWPRAVEWSRTISAAGRVRTDRMTMKTLKGR
jgi:hypothetical protein